ncbi:hypothetical protein ASD11_01185 [Aeromicrobium sp. Root495]|uniref:hypothetical protein n=1 Tax=Aeromicrobium sp. Root495 TaxID=1736550 RepID=UPI0006F7F7CD|nr:hypothetical protein [Aeromicrobium sp. Root495]KQY58309.1 hypothetical protein ASD11_01185 [Aeromicrobium sp. Root495]
MRALPAGWPDPSEVVQEPPAVYLRVEDSSWPPASVIDGEALPAGTTRVGEWSVTANLDAPLMPGQINAATQFPIAEASCTIPQSKSGLLAPWRAGDEAPPKSGQCELVASYDGPSGSTAFLLGKFILDPVRGKLSDKFLTLTMVQDLVKLRRANRVKNDWPSAFGSSFGSTSLLQAAALRNGYDISFSAEFGTELDGAYFPRKTDELSAMQEIAAANLGAIFLSLDGTTIRVLDAHYLAGEGSVVETLQVQDRFEDLAWAQDPGAVADRVEVSFVPPDFDDTPWGAAPFDAAPIFRFPPGAKVAAGATKTFTFDPGTIVFPKFAGPTSVYSTSARDGNGTSSVDLLVAVVTQVNSSTWKVAVTNDTGGTRYLLAPWYPSGTVGFTDFPRGTRSAVVGTRDAASVNEPEVLAWGASESAATNTLTFNLGRNIQDPDDAEWILDRIVARVQSASWTVDDVNVVPHLGREISDLDRLLYPDVDFDATAMVTGITTSGDSSGIKQSLSLAILG